MGEGGTWKEEIVKFKVSVEKRLYCTGVVEIEGDNAREAEEKVDAMIVKGDLQTTGVEWTEPTYEECSFLTTGDVDAFIS